MRRFIVFAGDEYYPSGGWLDFESSHDTLEAALLVANALRRGRADWSHVVDSESGEVTETTFPPSN